MKIQAAKEQHIEEIKTLFSTIRKDTNPEELRRLIKEKRIMVMKNRKRKIIAAFSYSVIGIIGLFTIMYIHRLAVTPQLQGQGIGTILLARIKGFSVKTGALAILLYSLEKARNFYRKNKLNNIWRFFWWSPKINC